MLKELLSAFKSVIRDNQAVYISVPITTGKSFISWYQKIGHSLKNDQYAIAHKQEVIQNNLKCAQAFVKRIQEQLPYEIIIDPSQLTTISGWTQGDYHTFWTSVIDEFVGKIYFIDGWFFSSGCSLEFARGFEKDCILLDEHGKIITLEMGEKLIGEALNLYKEANLDFTIHDKALNNLKKANSSHGQSQSF